MTGRHDEIPHLEDDETVPPRPEEEIADVARQEPQTGSVPVVAEPSPEPGDR
jgi:hypothetical protein